MSEKTPKAAPDKPRKKPGTKTGDNWKMTNEVLRKLELAAAMDCSIEEMCFFAEIAQSTFYRWVEQNKELSENLDRLRARPVLLARQTVIEAMQTIKDKEGKTTHHGDAKVAMEYLKAKKSNEFAERKELTGAQGKPIELTAVPFNELLEEAATLGIDTTTYEPLNSGTSDSGAHPQDSDQEGT